MEQRKIAILIACHKPYPLPEDPCYLPIEVGAELHDPIPGLIPDNSGENISSKNAHYCELTALFWSWKNLSADYIGLCHYRRYFASGFPRRISRANDYEAALAKAPIILPKLRHYWIETNYSHYIHAHHEQDLVVTRKILTELHPTYLASYDFQMRRRSGHRFNMFVMRRDLFEDYCAWLFSILFELERRLDISDYNAYNLRVFGFVAERLLDVWVEANHLPYKELGILYTENQHWIRKGSSFLLRKLAGGRK